MRISLLLCLGPASEEDVEAAEGPLLTDAFAAVGNGNVAHRRGMAFDCHVEHATS